eukprot:438655_1
MVTSTSIFMHPVIICVRSIISVRVKSNIHLCGVLHLLCGALKNHWKLMHCIYLKRKNIIHYNAVSQILTLDMAKPNSEFCDNNYYFNMDVNITMILGIALCQLVQMQ